MAFQDEIFNKGGFYNSSSGVFTAPVAGLYIFTVQLCGLLQKPIDNRGFGIFRFTSEYPFAVSLIFGGDLVSCRPTVGLTQIDANETVFLKTYGFPDNYTDFSDQFTGFLVNLQ